MLTQLTTNFLDVIFPQRRIYYYVLFCCMIAAGGAFLAYIQESRRQSAIDSFVANDFEVVLLFEDNRDQQQSLLKEVLSHTSTDPVLTIPGRMTRSYYQIDGSLPRFVQVVDDKGEPTKGVVYNVFSKPNALEKARTWLESKGYDCSKFNADWHSNSMKVPPAIATKGSSRVSPVVYFSGNGRTYMWANDTVYDISPGFTGNAGRNTDQAYENEKEFERFIKDIKTLAE